ncbi:hypothetical protein RN001_008415 [Aquatica leii]|uniref:SprT-like domain-containing protein n=1 Tax=Aquatica leii TaxID=1421715 RepID=A0AAN7PAA8_9COLE|nr:hypothetical protein RN001_008415 [Aquatica leii]
MDSSFLLLSSMSPKVTKVYHTHAHKKVSVPTLLALKKNVRRSSNFDHVYPPARLRPSIVVIESSTESTPSSMSGEQILNKSPIVIPDSDDEVIQCNKFLSQSKLVTITDWVKNVNVQKFDAVEEDTEVELKNTYNFAEMLSSLTKDIDVNQKLHESSSSDSGTSNSSSKFHAEILNELYRDTWKNLRDDILSRSTPRRKKERNVDYSKTDVKSKLYTNNFKTPTSPWTETLKGLCDSDSSCDQSNAKELRKPVQKRIFNSEHDSSFSWPNYLNKNSDRSISDLSDEIKVRAKPTKNLPKVKESKNKTVKDKKSTKVKRTGDEKRESLSLDRNCGVRKIVSVKETCNSNVTKSFLASLSGTVQLSHCDPSAKLFRNNFKGYKDELLKRLFKLYNETVFDNKIPEDTLFQWNERMRGTAGFCYCRKVTRRTGIIERNVRIVLSTKVIDSCDRLRDTLIHELCHAATWIVNEVANGHGDFWKAWATKAQRCFPELPPIKRCHDYVINTKYTYRCMDCGYSIGRHSKSLDTERKRCGYCYGKFEVLLNKTSKSGETKSVPVTPKKPPSGFALFVKEHYATYKTPQLNHAQVMKLLGQKFNEAKVPL